MLLGKVVIIVKGISRFLFLVCIVIYLTVLPRTLLAVVDDTFDVGLSTIDDVVSAIIIDDHKRIVFAGSFTTVAGVARSNIARVSNSGELDLSFAPIVDGEIHSVERMDGGRLLIVGSFQLVSGTPRQGIAILNEDGTLETNFAPEFGERDVTHAVVQNNNKVIVSVGKQPFLDNGVCCESVINPQRLVRLNLDGSEDQSFNQDASVARVTSVQVLSNDQLVVSTDGIGGVSFETGVLFLGAFSLKAYSPEGSLLKSVVIDNQINKFLVTAPNQFVAVGCFSRIGFELTDCDRTGCQVTGGVKKARLARFDSNLSLDLGFNVNNDFINDNCLLDADQNSNSEFIAIRVIGYPHIQRMAKISPTGNKFSEFDVGSTPVGASVLRVQSDDKILLGGRVVKIFGQELVDGVVRVFEEQATCFPIKNLNGNVSIYCL